jgi:flagellar basal-body rod protein FlgB
VDVLSRDVTLAALTAAQRGLDQRKELIAQNIANINTPGYKRRDVEFADTLARALEEPHAGRAAKAASLGNVVAREIIEERLFYRVDMGGVDLDREMAEFAKVQLQSSAVSQLIYKKIRQYREVIKEGRV